MFHMQQYSKTFVLTPDLCQQVAFALHSKGGCLPRKSPGHLLASAPYPEAARRKSALCCNKTPIYASKLKFTPREPSGIRMWTLGLCHVPRVVHCSICWSRPLSQVQS